MALNAYEATRIRHEQTEQQLTMRKVCLWRRKDQMSAVVDVLVRTDTDTVTAADRALRVLQPAET